MIEEIKNLCPCFDIHPFDWFEDLFERSIDFLKPGAGHGVSSQVAIGPWRRSRKGTRIVPQARSSERRTGGDYPLSNHATRGNSGRWIVAEARLQVGPIREPPVPVGGNVRAHARVKRFPRAEGADSVDRPAAKNSPQHLLLEMERQRIGGRENKIVSRIKGRKSAVCIPVLEIEHGVWFLAGFTAGEGRFLVN